MSNDKSREEFEAFSDKRNSQLECEGHKPGSKWHVTNAHYPTWQASREALVIEMTQTIRDLQSSVASFRTGYEAYERVNAELRAECYTLESQVKALQAEPNSYQAGFDAGRKSSAAHAENWRREAQACSFKVDELRAECEKLRAQKIHWVTQPGNGLIRCVSDDRYQKFSPSIRARYEPIAVQEDESLRKDHSHG